ncbi:MAG: RnfABCDGE type electron transport complex subunit G [Clostridia bacterium]|nr:RnfABCDGE type electron transport complex subunit G [Clostridia bacterium]
MFKEIIRPAIVLFLICALITGALAYVNGVTKPIIDESQKQAQRDGLAKVFPGADTFSAPQTADQLKGKGYQVSDRIVSAYEAQKNAETIGYVIEVSSRGYGGPIKMLVGIGMDGKILGALITSSNETPGLGSKAAEPAFMGQYLGAVSDEFKVVKGKASAEGDIQAVSGATISSRAVTQGVNDALKMVRSIRGGAK